MQGMAIPSAGGGWHAIGYTLRKTWKAGPLRMFRAMSSRNACKTCALGMGGQRGGMVNEAGHFPEFCKKSIQAAAADLQPPIPESNLTGAPLSFLQGLSSRQLEALGRIPAPLVVRPGSDRFQVAGWDEALDAIAAKLKATPPNDAFFYVSGRSSNEAGFLLQLFARAWGTNHVNNCSFYCHQASGVGLASVFGSSAGTVHLDDLDRCDTLVLIGANPASNHPRFMRTLMEIRRRGGRVIVINPLREIALERFQVPSDPRSLLFGSAIADTYLQPHLGTDLALLTHVACVILAQGGEDRNFLATHTTGWPELEAHLRAQDPSALARIHGVPDAQVADLAAVLIRSQATIFAWTMGITHHLHGTDSVRAVANLALLRGMAGKPGAGLLPLRGHSNIQGLGTVGVAPHLKPALATAIAEKLGIPIPSVPGMDTMTAMEAAAAGKVRSAWALGGNLFGANPDATFARQAFAAIDQVVYLNTTLNTGHLHGLGRETWILPVRARDEEDQATTQESMFSYLRLSDGGPARYAGARSEAWVIAEIARRVLGTAPVDWASLASHEQLRQLIAATVPGLAAVATIGATKTEFHIPGRQPHEGTFATPDGKAHLHPVAVPPALVLGARQVAVMTIRSEGQFNTVVYEDHDRYRGQERRDVILLNAGDVARLGLALDQRVTVTSTAGSLTVLVRTADLPAGNAAMYYPEANVLVPREVDPESGTPAFKRVVVTLS